MCCRRGHEEDIERACDMLRKRPSLASKFHTEIDVGDFLVKRMHPLHFMIVVQAPLSIIQQVHDMYPQALETEMIYNGFRGLPLHFACSHGGNIPESVVEFLVQQYPRALTKSNYMGLFPIHVAFQSKTYLERHQWPSLGLFQILFQAMQSLQPTSQRKDNNPTTSSTRHNIQDNDDNNKYWKDEHPSYNLTPLEWAFHMEYDMEIIDYFMLHFPRDLHKFRLEVSLGDDRTFDKQLATKVGQLLPQLEKLEVVCSKKLCVDGFLHLLHLLCSNLECDKNHNYPILTQLHILKIPNEYILYRFDVWKALASFVERNTTVQDLTLSSRRHVYGEDLPFTNRRFLYSIAKGLQSNNSLRHLTLQQFQIPESHILCEFLSSGTALQFLHLEDIRIEGPWIQQDPDTDTLWKPSATLETLTFTSPKTHPEFLSGFLRQLGRLPSLKTLSISVTTPLEDSPKTNSRLDLTALLADILNQNRLKRLSVTVKNDTRQEVTAGADSTKEGGTCVLRGDEIDLARFCRTCLATNTSLQVLKCRLTHVTDSYMTVFLKTLEHHNATLRDVPMQDWNMSGMMLSQQQDKKIAYWLSLNRYGRAKARDSNTDKSELVHLLCQVLPEKNHQQTRSEGNNTVLECFRVIYGLLREMPSKWTS